MDYSKHIAKAEEASRRRNHDFAVQLYRQILDIEPDVGEARAGLRRALKARADAKRGGKLMKLVKGAGPLTAGRGLAKAGKHDAAAKQFESYLDSAPLDVEANMLLGTSLEAAGHFHSALAVFEFIAEIDPKNAQGLKQAGAMMARTGDAPKALEYYERALEADPRDRDALKARKDLAAQAALSASRYDEVSHSREQLVDADQTRRLEQQQRRQRTPEEWEAERDRLEAKFAEDTTDVAVMVELATVHERLKDPDAAVDVLERAVTYAKDDASLQDHLGRVRGKALKRALAKAGKDGDAEKADAVERDLLAHEAAELRRRLGIHPGDTSLRYELGLALARAGDHDGAAAEFQKALADPRRGLDARIGLARAFEGKGFEDLAEKEYQKALDACPQKDQRHLEILYSLASLSEARGDRERAREHFTRIFEVDVSYRDVADKMAELR